MAKDAQGHGSDQRGGSFDRINEQRKAQGFKPMDAKRRGMYQFLDYMAGDGPKPGFMGNVISGNHPKSSPVDTHPAMKVVADKSVAGATHALVKGGKVIGRLYKSGSPAWR